MQGNLWLLVSGEEDGDVGWLPVQCVVRKGGLTLVTELEEGQPVTLLEVDDMIEDSLRPINIHDDQTEKEVAFQFETKGGQCVQMKASSTVDRNSWLLELHAAFEPEIKPDRKRNQDATSHSLPELEPPAAPALAEDKAYSVNKVNTEDITIASGTETSLVEAGVAIKRESVEPAVAGEPATVFKKGVNGVPSNSTATPRSTAMVEKAVDGASPIGQRMKPLSPVSDAVAALKVSPTVLEFGPNQCMFCTLMCLKQERGVHRLLHRLMVLFSGAHALYLYDIPLNFRSRRNVNSF